MAKTRPLKKRKLLNNPWLATVVGLLLNGYGELVRRTSRLRFDIDPEAERLVREARVPLIYALWHQQVFFLPLLRIYGRQPLAVLLSAHRDARIVGVAARLRGIQLVEGSSTRGGTQAYRQLLTQLKGGQSVCITPDGPRGPARRLKPGVIQLARHSGCAVVPVAMAFRRVHILRTWDRTLLPLPFGICVLAMGAPLYLEAGGSLEGQQHQVAEALEVISQRAADRLSP